MGNKLLWQDPKLTGTFTIEYKRRDFVYFANFQPKIVDAELRMHETVVLKILHLIYIKLTIYIYIHIYSQYIYINTNVYMKYIKFRNL